MRAIVTALMMVVAAAPATAQQAQRQRQEVPKGTSLRNQFGIDGKEGFISVRFAEERERARMDREERDRQLAETRRNESSEYWYERAIQEDRQARQAHARSLTMSADANTTTRSFDSHGFGTTIWESWDSRSSEYEFRHTDPTGLHRSFTSRQKVSGYREHSRSNVRVWGTEREAYEAGAEMIVVDSESPRDGHTVREKASSWIKVEGNYVYKPLQYSMTLEATLFKQSWKAFGVSYWIMAGPLPVEVFVEVRCDVAVKTKLEFKGYATTPGKFEHKIELGVEAKVLVEGGGGVGIRGIAWTGVVVQVVPVEASLSGSAKISGEPKLVNQRQVTEHKVEAKFALTLHVLRVRVLFRFEIGVWFFSTKWEIVFVDVAAARIEMPFAKYETKF